MAFDLRPMLASLTDAPLADPQFVYEPKYDGIRAIVEVAPRGQARLWSRLGNEKTRQFPEIAKAFEDWARRRTSPLVLDGEIVALDKDGKPTGFQQLQGRINLGGGSGVESRSKKPRDKPAPSGRRPTVAILIFDLLRDGDIDYRDRPLTERRAALERLFARTKSPVLRISTQVRGDGRALYDEAMASGWEGLIAKHASSMYKSGKRTPDWRKMKIVHEQEFVIGGWTEPRQSRGYFGALLIGVYDADADRGAERAAPHQGPASRKRLIYSGHIGTGFNERELARVMALLEPLEITSSPFEETPKANERPHWVKPELVAQVKFTEWTADGRLRHPVYLGLRDDKKAKDVTRERQSSVVRRSTFEVRRSDAAAAEQAGRTKRTKNVERRTRNDDDLSGLLEQLTALESARKDGVLALPDGEELAVTNLHKVFWPKQKLTKGDLFRYYVRSSRYLLPAIADRAAGDETVSQRRRRRRRSTSTARPMSPPASAPPSSAASSGRKLSAARSRRCSTRRSSPRSRRIRGSRASISRSSPTSRPSISIRPTECPSRKCSTWRAGFATSSMRSTPCGVPKTSGADGLHIYVPLPPGTPYDAGLLFCQIVAALVGPETSEAGDDRARGARRAARASTSTACRTSSARRSPAPTARGRATTPASRRRSRWQEVDEGFDRQAFHDHDVRRNDSSASATCGRRCASRRASTWRRLPGCTRS